MRPIRLNGWQQLCSPQRQLASLPMLYPNDNLEDFSKFVPELLRFCAEKALWGGFLRVLFGKNDSDIVEKAVRDSSRLLNNDLVVDRSFFREI